MHFVKKECAFCDMLDIILTIREWNFPTGNRDDERDIKHEYQLAEAR